MDEPKIRQRKVRARRVNLDLVNKRLQTALNEDTKWILDNAVKGKLSKRDVDSLDKYLKLLKLLKSLDNEIPLDDLVKLASKDKSTDDAAE